MLAGISAYVDVLPAPLVGPSLHTPNVPESFSIYTSFGLSIDDLVVFKRFRSSAHWDSFLLALLTRRQEANALRAAAVPQIQLLHT